MRVGVSAGGEGRWRVEGLGEGPGAVVTEDLAGVVGEIEERHGPRWVWAGTHAVYPGLLAAGVRVARCHDLGATAALLAAHAGGPAPGDAGAAAGEAAVSGGARAAAHGAYGAAAVFGAVQLGVAREVDDQPALFGAAAEPEPQDAPPLAERDAAQLAAVAAAARESPGFPLLVAAESAATLAAAEMTAAGLPWDAAVHDAVLEEALGPRPRHGGRPRKLQALAEEVAEALGAPSLNVDSQPSVLAAFRRAGVPLDSLRAHHLRDRRHPAIEPLLRYKELARLHSAHGWAWREQWVRGGRFRPEYVPGGVVSGRWATRGGGALQIPKVVRAAVVADAGHVLVLADAGQVEPRVLAAMANDPAMIAATREGDLYAAIAAQALGRPEARPEAKIALLSAMYGGGAGSAAPALAALRRRFPRALELLERAARTGEDGGTVRSVLGRTCPPPRPDWQDAPDEVAAARARARGRFTRNFVVQASAADWANVLVAGLRTRLAPLPGAELVFFQHDEVVVHAPAPLGDRVVELVAEAGAEATRLVLGDRGVHVPLQAAVAASYGGKP